MGVVYKAEDLKLRRTVALKFLPTHAAENRDRFLREAQAAASLNHPNICTIFEIDDENDFIAMELVEGQNIKEKLAARPLPLDEALQIAIQACAGLEAAHEKGIIHRDIKPANLMLTAQSQVKIMDFGLAQAGDRTRITKTGSSLGTPAYMSPEQAKGEPVDRRTDLWSLSVTLYEMIAAKPAFSGEMEAAVARAIVSDEPEPLTSLRAGLPLEVDRVMTKALAKQPGDRYQNAGDLAVDLRALLHRGVRRQPHRNRSPKLLLATIGACFMLATLAFLAGRWSAKPAETPPIAFAMDVGGTSFADRQMAVSPDGTRLAYTARRGDGPRAIYVRSLSSTTETPLAGTEEGVAPFWSPDARWIGFFADGKLKKIPSGGGSAFDLATTSGQYGAWNLQGEIVTTRDNRSPFIRIPANGGPATEFTSLDVARKVNSHRFPSFLPDGRLLFTARATKDNTEVLVRSPSGENTALVRTQSNAQYALINGGPDGYLLFVRNSTLFAQRFNTDSLKMSGDPIPVADGVLFTSTGAYGHFSVSSNGRTLAYVKGTQPQQQLSWYGADGTALGAIGPPGEILGPRISPDGKSIVFSRPDPQTGNRDLWMVNTESGVVERLTLDPGNDWQPFWSRDGSQILFASDREDGMLKPFMKGAQAASQESRLENMRADPMDLSPNGKYLLFTTSGASGLETLTLSTPRKRAPFLQPSFGEQDAKFSPDGKWVAYTSNKSGTFEVYIRSFRAETDSAEPVEYRVSTGSGAFPRWRRDGRELYYLNRELSVMAVRFENAKALTPRKLFRTCLQLFGSSNWQSSYDVNADGTRFVFACDEKKPPMQMHMVVNWMNLLPQHP